MLPIFTKIHVHSMFIVFFFNICRVFITQSSKQPKISKIRLELAGTRNYANLVFTIPGLHRNKPTAL